MTSKDRVLVISECASAHDGSLEQALIMVRVAAEAGADAVKFQFWSDAEALADRRHVPKVYRDVYRRYRMPAHWLPVLAEECRRAALQFGVTCYLPGDVKIIEPFTAWWKVASFECEAVDLRDAISAASRKPLMLSVGMQDVAGVREARRRWRDMTDSLSVLHCVSAYPARPCDQNLAVIRQLSLRGFSDHTGLWWMGGAAVIAGARIVEAHLRLQDTDPENPDFRPALAPEQFRAYVKHIREVTPVVGDGIKRVMEAEGEMATYKVTA